MRRRAIAATVVGALVLVVAPSARATHDDLPRDQDNGAQGRSNGLEPVPHVPPVEACRDKLKASAGSLVIRVLPRGPLARDGSLAFESGLCVYLPPGYMTSGLRYPVLYLLHGGGGDQADYVTYSNLRSMMDKLIRADPRKAVIVVMPSGFDAQWYDFYDGSVLNEQYVLDHVIRYVDYHFRTIADRRGRIITGSSNGGYGALHYAAKAPDRFVAAGSMSGNVGGRSFYGLGTPLFPGGPAFQEAGSYYYGNVPAELAPNLDDVDLIINWGASCSSDATVDLCASWGFEQFFRLDNQYLRDRLASVGHRGAVEYSEDEGGHAWRWWTTWLRDKHLPFLLRRAADPEAASKPQTVSRPRFPFRYRSIAPSFSIYGYDVSVRREASEFLDLWDVRPNAFKIQGSGTATVTTARLYRPGRSYRISASGMRSLIARADPGGRLRIVVPLGEAHGDEQYSPSGRMQQMSGDYWTMREVKIR
jgi:S-formylglutathione hydrolase FrmB